MKLKILGTEYTVCTHRVSEDDILRKNHWDGYCDEDKKEIVIADVMDEEFFVNMDAVGREKYRRKILRHEILHAFLNESGLSDNSAVPSEGWAKYEEMIDWFAIQFPKIRKVYKKAGCL